MDIEKKVQILRACSSKKGERCSSCSAFGQGDRNCMRNAMRDAEIPAGTRICQFRLHRENPHVVFEQVEHLENENRGGFGSTGV